MWDNLLKSKCPKCGKLYSFSMVFSCNSYTSMDMLNSYFDEYIKKCDECGMSFDQSENLYDDGSVAYFILSKKFME
jgi:hypothetical protein